jgi:RHS repeat-associated protein
MDYQGGNTPTYIGACPERSRRDADGQRVRKTVAGSSVDYLYDLAGHQIAEVSSSDAWNRGEVYAGGRHLATYSNGTTYFIHSDWLGTERARTDLNANLYESCTSLPFGDALSCSGGDPSPMHFTGKERDSESGLDNFGARYNGSSMGRFTSADHLLSSGRLTNPQTWNRYAYALNNPLRIVDPTGLWDWDNSAGSDMSDDDLEAIARDKHNKRHKWAQNALKFRVNFRDALDRANEAAGSD